MHGYGSNEGDLFGLVPHLPGELAVASLRAPIPMMPGFCWFARAEPNEVPAGSKGAVAAVLSWLDGLEPAPSVGLLGFSQGGAMAIELLRASPRRFSYVVQLSGSVVGGRRPEDDLVASVRPPVFWGRGLNDPVIGEARVEIAQSWLSQHVALEARTYPVGHTIAEEEVFDVSAFVKVHLPGG